jgi:hypothetical protein
MKSNSRIVARTAVVLVVVSWLALPLEAADFIVSVSRVVGQARYQTNGLSWVDLRTGDRISSGTFLQTNKTNSIVNLKLIEPNLCSKSTLQVLPNSGLNIIKARPESSEPGVPKPIRLKVHFGRILLTLGDKCNQAFELSSPLGAILVAKPSELDEVIFVFSERALTVVKGELTTQTTGTAPRKVKAGQQFLVANGEVFAVPADAPELRLDREMD